jgi:hypothetical protein
MQYKVSPSDLTFLYEGYKRCFYLKVVKGISQPSIPLPSIFTKIASLLNDHYDGKCTGELHTEPPPGVVSLGEKYVKSIPIELPNHDSTSYISGRFDIVISFDDGTYGVINFKTGNELHKTSQCYLFLK